VENEVAKPGKRVTVNEKVVQIRIMWFTKIERKILKKVGMFFERKSENSSHNRYGRCLLLNKGFNIPIKWVEINGKQKQGIIYTGQILLL